MTSKFPDRACGVTCTWKIFIAEEEIQKQNITNRHLLWHYSHLW